MVFGIVISPVIFLVLLFVILCFESYSERSLMTALTVLIFGGVGVFLYSATAIVTHIILYKMYYGIFALSYAPLGLGWALIKYRLSLSKEVERLKFSFKNRFEYTDSKSLTFPEYLKENLGSVTASRTKIMHWIAYWPPSLMCSLFSDFLISMGGYLYEKTAFIFEKIRTKVLNKHIN